MRWHHDNEVGWKNPAATSHRVGGTSHANEPAPDGKEKSRQSLVRLVERHLRTSAGQLVDREEEATDSASRLAVRGAEGGGGEDDSPLFLVLSLLFSSSSIFSMRVLLPRHVTANRRGNHRRVLVGRREMNSPGEGKGKARWAGRET